MRNACVICEEKKDDMSRPRRPFPKGIYLNRARTRYRVTWQEGGRQAEAPGGFPLDTPIATLVAYRKLKVQRAAPPPASGGPAGSFARDVVRYLRTRKGRPSYASERSHLKAWVATFGRRSRHVITPEAIRVTLADWTTLSPKTLRHRLNVLTQVFKLLDPETATPVDRVKRPALEKRRPQGVPDSLIEHTARRLAEQERRGRLRDGKTRARFLVLATCGKRPCQMMRAHPMHVDWEARVWHVEPAKNSHGGPLYLNDEMLDAWRSFAAADAWGSYDTVSFAKTLRRNGWPAGVRPYRMRHQTLQTMSNAGVDFGAVQQAAGHASPDTTRRFYVPHELATSQAASLAIDGRFSAEAFAETRRYRTGVPIGGAPNHDRVHDPRPDQQRQPTADPPASGPATIMKCDHESAGTELETSENIQHFAHSPVMDRRPPSVPKRVKTR